MAVTLPSASGVCSRTSGVAPLGVHFDVSSLVSTVWPTFAFHGCRCIWDFGDSGAGTHPNSGRDKNSARGPVAFHLYETPNASPGYSWSVRAQDIINGVEVSISGTITVSDPATVYGAANTICYSIDSDFTGAPAYVTGGNKITTSNWATIVAAMNTGKQIMLRGGGRSWNTGGISASLPSSGPGMVTGFGPGAKPVINTTGINQIFILGSGPSDWRIADLKLVGDRTIGGQAIQCGGFPARSRVLVLRVDIDSFAYGVHQDLAGIYNHQEIYVVEGSWNNIGGTNGIGYGGYMGGLKNACVGVSNTNFNASQGHILRIWHGRQMVIQHNSLLDAPNQKHVLKFHNERDIPGIPDSQYNVISDNILRGGAVPLVYGPQNNDPDHTGISETLTDAIIERNLLFGSAPPADDYAGACGMHLSGLRISVRTNFFRWDDGTRYGQGVIAIFKEPSSPSPQDVWVYHNGIYKNTVNQEFVPVRFDVGATNADIRNNHCVLESNSGGLPGPPTTYAGAMEYVADMTFGSAIQQQNILRKGVITDLVDPDNSDYHLVSGSTMRNAGVAGLMGIHDDWDLRDVDSTPDIGPYQFVAAGGGGGAVAVMAAAKRRQRSF